MREALGHELLQEFTQGLEQLTLAEDLGQVLDQAWEQASVQGQEHVFSRAMGQAFQLIALPNSDLQHAMLDHVTLL